MFSVYKVGIYLVNQTLLTLPYMDTHNASGSTKTEVKVVSAGCLHTVLLK